VPRAPQGRGTWRETQVRLSRTTVTTFDGPGTEFLLVIHGRRDRAARTTRQNATKTNNRTEGTK